jgi:hypothetical protein
VYFHDVPLIGQWQQHGVCHYDLDFFRGLIKMNQYEPIMLFITDYNRNDSEVVVASYYKTNCCQDFMSFEQFEALPGLHSIFKQHDTAEIEFHFVGELSSSLVIRIIIIIIIKNHHNVSLLSRI